MTERKLCSRCVLPHSPPDITLDAEGICSSCREHDKAKAAGGQPTLLESDFTAILQQHRGKHEFDCMVMCSGGKDSTAALYYAVKRYKLNVLAFTFDHGFETDEALANVRRAVTKLDVPYVTYRSTQMRGMFQRLVDDDSPAVICHVCAIWYMGLSYRMAERFDAPIIIAGWTKGQMGAQPLMSKCACNTNAPEYAAMGKATKDFLAGIKDPRYKDFPASMEDANARAQKRRKCLVLSPHWFLPYEVEDYVAVIQKELDWRYPTESYPAKTTNCSLNFVSVQRAMEKFGYTHYHVEMSKLIRAGVVTRQQALETLKTDFDPALIERVLTTLNKNSTP